MEKPKPAIPTVYDQETLRKKSKWMKTTDSERSRKRPDDEDCSRSLPDEPPPGWAEP